MNDYINFNQSITKQLLESELKFRNRIAIQYKSQTYTYQLLFEKAKAIANLLVASPQSRCLILAERTPAAYVGLLAALLSGKAYVFLNKKDLAPQLEKAISLTDSNLVITDELNLSILNDINESLNYICLNELGDVANPFLTTNFQNDNLSVKPNYIPPLQVYKYAYLMFTSGSTGEPKGVPITHENLQAFLINILQRIKPTKQDRFAHINELTFDFSVYEIFSCWLVGACLCVFPDNHMIRIDHYFKKNQITYWSCVPSLIGLLNQMKKLDVNNFNTIRYSVFCGEALTYETAALWKKAAPQSVIDNLYGPTEATVAITGYLWNEESGFGILPIGWPFPNQEVYLLNKNNQEVKQGEIGEICLAGTQICDKYWNNEAVTSSCFLNYQGQRIYKTGDLAYWDEKNGLCYKGRIDDQLKINGYRIEKLDIENRIKAILKTQAVSVIAFNDKQTGAVKSLNCFFSDVSIDEADAIKLCRQMLPDSMIPARVIKLDQFPYNKNGKIDYPYLYRLASLETQASQ